jgi:purine-nucleoside phosphorylase
MLRALGADLASMSTVPEAIAARYLGIRVAAVACISNRGSGMDAQAIRHGAVLDAVDAAVRVRRGGFERAVRLLASASGD